jgi:nicotinamidase-related amidase
MVIDDHTALILIDVQKGFENEAHWGGNRSTPKLEEHIAQLLKHWRELGRPIAHVQHASTDPKSPLHPSKPGHALADYAAPVGEEPVFVKNVNSAFVGTHLFRWLDEQDINKLVFVGLTTNHCVSTSVRFAGNYGFEAYVVADAVATFDRVGHNGKRYAAEDVHDISLANLNEEFATVLNTGELL